MHFYANLNMQKYVQNMQKQAVTPSALRNISSMHSYAFICIYMQKYARYVSMKVKCKICKNMHTPLC